MNFIKKILFILSYFSIFFSIVGCCSFYVPGEKEIILRNINIEYFNIAEEYFNLKNYSKAIDYYKIAIKDASLYSSACYKLARSYAFSSKWEDAYYYYNDVLKTDPDNLNIKISLAYITAMKGDNDSAIEQYKTLYEKNPYEEILLESYIDLLVFVDKKEEAKNLFAELKEKFPNNKKISEFSEKLEIKEEKDSSDNSNNDTTEKEIKKIEKK